MTIAPKSPARFKLGRQSSLAPESRTPIDTLTEDEDDELAAAASSAGIVDPTIRLMYLANEGDIDGINKMLDSGTNVDYRDIDGRTALHVAACQGRTDVVQLLLSRRAKVDTMDRWGSTPLADAVYYKNHDVIKLLEQHGAKPPIAPMHVLTDKEVPEYEIHPTELDFSNSVKISKGTFHKASWRGIDVAVKAFGEEMFTDEDKVNAFRDELALLQKIRHPNVVQFLGAVTQSTPMMIVTEYLPKGDLRQYLDRKGPLMPAHAVKFALEIARGLNYLHEHKPEAIIHCDLEPPNILRDDSGHLKVADFGVSKLLVFKKTVKKDRPVTSLDSSWRYMAPEVYRNEEYDTKVDIFSFALILQEMIEGCVPFHEIEESEVPKAYIEDERPPFNAPAKSYPFGLRELIQDCWDKEASKRPTFREIISALEIISDRIARKTSWKVMVGRCIPRFRLFKKRDYVNPSSNRSSSSITR
ncbi:PREDICTED: serine/threonine-protein kinase HT1-like [Camelina sativa]|uniref:Serine/threonine-protein kinase HT1-like n=1 Tax=Camelina sativa TaxID=90675 RepID=A0ABM0TKM2_CAMSA|nr:PREDICTED: serine/threonine-protein kinase HT1-like [Camelina sativa]